jgi:hypothetical protein
MNAAETNMLTDVKASGAGAVVVVAEAAGVVDEVGEVKVDMFTTIGAEMNVAVMVTAAVDGAVDAVGADAAAAVVAVTAPAGVGTVEFIAKVRETTPAATVELWSVEGFRCRVRLV